MELSYSGSGNVLYQEKEYRCDLYLNEDEGGILFKIYVNKAMASFIELPFEMDCLSGRLDNGFNFIAFGCFRTNMESRIAEGQSVFTFRARSMLEGVERRNPKGKELYKVRFGFADILEWGSFSGYRIGENHALSTGEPVEIKFYEDDQITIKYLVSTSMLPVVQEELLEDTITLSQQGAIEIQSKQQETMGLFEAYYRKIKRLIEISMQRTIRLTSVTGWSHDICYAVGEENMPIERPIPILTAELCWTNSNNHDRIASWKWFTFPELLKNNSFRLYMEKYDILEPIIELYMEAFSPNGISHKRLFLNLVQGLETYHSRFITNDLGEFKKRIEEVILKNRPRQFVARDISFLMAKSYKFITLESRLADLLTANFEICFDAGEIRKYDFPGVISATRNYLIHYDERIKREKRVLSDDEIEIYNKTLLTMLEYYLLRELGFTDTIATKKKTDGAVGTRFRDVRHYKGLQREGKIAVNLSLAKSWTRAGNGAHCLRERIIRGAADRVSCASESARSGEASPLCGRSFSGKNGERSVRRGQAERLSGLQVDPFRGSSRKA